MAKINKTKDRAGAGEDTVKEDTYSLLGGGCKLVQLLQGNQCGVPSQN